MERAVMFGGTKIEYEVRRSSRRTTVSIAVDPVDGVVLTAPRGTTAEKLDEIVRRKAAWIREKVRRQSDLPPPLPAREFVSGETFLYLGRQYRLRVEPTVDDVRPLALRGGWLDLPVPESLPNEYRGRYARAALLDWYRERAAVKLPERAEFWADRAGLSRPTVVVKTQQKRWGSCDNRGTLRLNWRIVQAPMSLVDYVVAHEVCHLAHKDHTRAFWSMLGRLIPDYDTRKAALRVLGPRLEW